MEFKPSLQIASSQQLIKISQQTLTMFCNKYSIFVFLTTPMTRFTFCLFFMFIVGYTANAQHLPDTGKLVIDIVTEPVTIHGYLSPIYLPNVPASVSYIGKGQLGLQPDHLFRY